MSGDDFRPQEHGGLEGFERSPSSDADRAHYAHNALFKMAVTTAGV